MPGAKAYTPGARQPCTRRHVLLAISRLILVLRLHLFTSTTPDDGYPVDTESRFFINGSNGCVQCAKDITHKCRDN